MSLHIAETEKRLSTFARILIALRLTAEGVRLNERRVRRPSVGRRLVPLHRRLSCDVVVRIARPTLSHQARYGHDVVEKTASNRPLLTHRLPRNACVSPFHVHVVIRP